MISVGYIVLKIISSAGSVRCQRPLSVGQLSHPCRRLLSPHCARALTVPTNALSKGLFQSVCDSRVRVSLPRRRDTQGEVTHQRHLET